MLIIFHLVVIIPCIFLGAYLLLFPKATTTHRLLGKIYLTLMGITALITLIIPSQWNARILNHFGPLHLLSCVTLYTISSAYLAVRKKNIASHKRSMFMLYFCGIILAGSWAILGEGRLLNLFFFH